MTLMVSDYATTWVCIDCVLMAANGEATESPDRVPLNLLAGQDYALGITEDEHVTNFDHDSDCIRGFCDCEVITFSNRTCGGCGSQLAGERHAVTIWIN